VNELLKDLVSKNYIVIVYYIAHHTLNVDFRELVGAIKFVSNKMCIIWIMITLNTLYVLLSNTVSVEIRDWWVTLGVVRSNIYHT
jgi:hypothetical protein